MDDFRAAQKGTLNGFSIRSAGLYIFFSSFFLSFLLVGTTVLAEPRFYPITPAANNTVIGTGLGLESGLIGIRYSTWLKDPNIIINLAFGLEGFSPTMRIPLLNFGNYDFYFDAASLFTPGLLGVITGDEGGLLFSKNTILFAAGIGIQRWVRKRTRYSFYLSIGLNYWFQLSGQHEGSGGIGMVPEFQMGVLF